MEDTSIKVENKMFHTKSLRSLTQSRGSILAKSSHQPDLTQPEANRLDADTTIRIKRRQSNVITSIPNLIQIRPAVLELNHADRQTGSALYAFISSTSCTEHIIMNWKAYGTKRSRPNLRYATIQVFTRTD
jgi:hypothetical protein